MTPLLRGATATRNMMLLFLLTLLQPILARGGDSNITPTVQSPGARFPLLAGGISMPRSSLLAGGISTSASRSEPRPEQKNLPAQDLLDEDPDGPDLFERTYQSLTGQKRGIMRDIASGLLEHAAHGATDMDKKLAQLVRKVMSVETRAAGAEQWEELKVWFRTNPVQGTILVCGMGGIAFKKDTITSFLAEWIKPVSKHFADPAVSWVNRGSWFVTLMTLRLFVTVAVPPLSPLFSTLVDDGMPETQQALAMPTFLLASTLAGAAPQALNFLVSHVANGLIAPCLGKEKLTSRDPVSKFMVRFMNAHPFSCWIYPGMKKVFDKARKGKMDARSLRYAALATILFGHVVPFAGAGVTWAAISITPYWSDNMGVQPFGMTEDLIFVAVNQILHGVPQIAQRGFFPLNITLHAVTGAGRSTSPKLRTKAAILVAFAMGIWGMLEALEAGADPIIARELWGKFLLSMMTLQVFGMPFLAEGFSSMLEWAFDWTTGVEGDHDAALEMEDVEQGGDGHGPFFPLPQQEEVRTNDAVAAALSLEGPTLGCPSSSREIPGDNSAEIQRTRGKLDQLNDPCTRGERTRDQLLHHVTTL